MPELALLSVNRNHTVSSESGGGLGDGGIISSLMRGELEQDLFGSISSVVLFTSLAIFICLAIFTFLSEFWCVSISLVSKARVF